MIDHGRNDSGIAALPKIHIIDLTNIIMAHQEIEWMNLMGNVA
jgi:hypothetical protein